MNHVILLGNLTADPEIRHTPKGLAVADFTIAHNKRWTDDSGEQKEKVSFIGCVMFGKRAEAFAQYHKKGSKALVEGELAQESWEDKKTGEKRSKTKVHVNSWEFVGGKPEGQPQRQERPKATAAPKAAPADGAPEEDEVPF